MIYYRDSHHMPVFDIKMMHKSLVTKRFQSEAIGEIHEDSSGDIERDLNLDESVDMFNDERGANSRLASRGWNIFWKSNKKLTRESPGMSSSIVHST